MVETGHLPSCPLIEIRSPWSSSSQTFATVPAFPSLRITALPTSSFSACSNSQRIAEARSFGVGIGDAASLAETRESWRDLGSWTIKSNLLALCFLDGSIFERTLFHGRAQPRSVERDRPQSTAVHPAHLGQPFRRYAGSGFSEPATPQTDRARLAADRLRGRVRWRLGQQPVRPRPWALFPPCQPPDAEHEMRAEVPAKEP